MVVLISATLCASGEDARTGRNVRKFHFISGLPRSGSTLLAGILQQNPRFHAAMSSPVAALMNSTLEQTGAQSEFYPLLDEAKRKRLCRAIVDAYYDDVDAPVVFDTNRIWTARLHQLVELFDDFRMICCVRNPAWVLDSFERMHRKHPFDYSRLFGAGNRMTVYSRCESMAQANGVVGTAWTALKEAFYGEYSDRLLLVDYDLLAQYPERAIGLIYQFLGEEPITHDFDNVEYEASEFDAHLGARELHTVKRKVAFEPRRSILPPDLFKKYSEMAFWHDMAGTSANILQPKSTPELTKVST